MNYNTLAGKKSVTKTVKALEKKGYQVYLVKSKNDAYTSIKKLIPPKASVMNGSSVTLEQIGYIDYLASEKHNWVDLHAKIKAEPVKADRAKLRRESVLSDYYLGSVHALAETGEFVIASNTGSQLPHVVFTSPNLIFVVSTKKIVSNLEDALARVKDYVYPLEDKHMRSLYNQHTDLNKIVIFRGEAPMIGRKITFILVEENLGF
jgi:L-lactate utilization protein LutB